MTWCLTWSLLRRAPDHVFLGARTISWARSFQGAMFHCVGNIYWVKCPVAKSTEGCRHVLSLSLSPSLFLHQVLSLDRDSSREAGNNCMWAHNVESDANIYRETLIYSVFVEHEQQFTADTTLFLFKWDISDPQHHRSSSSSSSSSSCGLISGVSGGGACWREFLKCRKL